MKVLVFTPVYQPNEITLENLRDRMMSGVDQAIFLNSVFEVPNFQNLLVFGNGCNRGISAPINEVMRFSRTAGYDFVLFLDQDTKVDLKSLMPRLESFLEAGELKNTAVLFLRSNVFGDRPYGDLITNSGALFSVTNFFKVGGFNEDYFLDGLDYEFCIRIWRKGLKIINIPMNQYFDHASLQDGSSFRIFGKDVYLRVYSDQRNQEMSIFFKQTIVSLLKNKEWRLLYIFTRSFLTFRLGRLLSVINR